MNIARKITGKRMKWAVLGLWVVLVFALGPLAGKLGGVENNEAAAWLPNGAESTQVLKLQEQFRDTETSVAVVIYERPSGITAADQAKARADIAAFRQIAGTGKAQGPLPSRDGKALQTLVPIQNEKVGDAVGDARDAVKRAPPGLNVHVTGPAGSAADLFGAFTGMDGFLLMAAGLVVIVLLLVIYRSPILWLIPVLGAVGALTVSQAVVYLLAKHAGLTVNGKSAAVLTVLVFGVATDYALLLVARYREELHRHQDRHEAMAKAVRRAGPAILASASTVAAGLLCLLLATMNSTKGLGPVAAVGVITALIAMTTLFPALLVVFGRWIFWPRRPRYEAGDRTPEHGLWARVARAVGARPRMIWAVTSLALIAVTFGLGSLKPHGLSDTGQFVKKPDSIVGAEFAARHFPAGTGAPAIVIGDAESSARLNEVISRTPGVAEVSRPATAHGHVQYEATLTAAARSEAAEHTVGELRKAVHAVPGAKVGGLTAITVDTQHASARDNKVIIPVVLAVILLILVALLRSIVAPLLMMGTVVLSFAAALGASGLVFHHLFGFEGTDTGFPLEAFIYLVALGVDYNIFLMHRVREESQAHGTRRGVLRGLTATGGVITSAGLVLAATFAVLATMPLVFMVELGFVVAFGVLLDSIVVRSLLLPALAYDLGRRIWAPSRLAARPEIESESESQSEAVAGESVRVLDPVG
jgi:RND superfamily putative drug exporter